jgi:glycosyltransferase involved in cell wall biosynthesis
VKGAEMMKVTYVIREYINLYPPCISQILMLNDLGVDISVVCGDIDEHLKSSLESKGINCYILGNRRVNNRYIGKIQSYYRYRKSVMRLIDKNNLRSTLFWFGTADSAFALYPWVNGYNFVMNILELYDKNPFYRKCIRRVGKNAKAVIANEETRSYIMKNWYELADRPYVMPNKPYEHPRERNQPIDGLCQEVISRIRESRIIIYQGLISSDRDLEKLAYALRDLDKDYSLLLMGKEVTESISKLQSIYPKTYYVGYIPAPLHLGVTSYGHIGVANYDDSSLNNLFCAPNKIYEYAGFGIPVLGSSVPGLINTIGRSKAGICVDFDDINSIKEGIETIDENYSEFHRNALIFFQETDNLAIMEEIIRNCV